MISISIPMVGIRRSSIDCGVDRYSMVSVSISMTITISMTIVSISSRLGISGPLAIMVSMSVISITITMSIVSGGMSISISMGNMSITMSSISQMSLALVKHQHQPQQQA